MSTTASLLLGVVLLIGNAFFVAAEFAVISARRHRLEELAGGASRLTKAAARAAVRGGRELSLMLAGAQLGITLCSLGLGMVTEPAIEHLLEPVFAAMGAPETLRVAISFTIALALVTFLHMVIGEMAPKSWALTHPEQAALGLALPFRGFVWLARPLLAAMNGFSNLLLKLFGVNPRDELATTRTPHQLAMLVGESGRMGLLDRAEHDLLTRALRVHGEGVDRLAIPIGEVAAVPANAPQDHVHREAIRSGHVRLLVHTGTPEDVVGVLHARDALVHPNRTPGELARPIPHLTTTTTVPEAVATLQEARAHLGLVTNAANRVVGMVSLSDLLGELLDIKTPATN
ncbi:hemolysin family protein [Sinosporangium siamense]|uniref:Membrane protein n=1 Tax=Sinosporangium siamense TaxID=1367973 RepID=A0A919RL94_9ACTN|nr:hemolysin family protein [Sinosporangium siamense]GII95848.1 membrane protein [Sinosporangium siamense]